MTLQKFAPFFLSVTVLAVPFVLRSQDVPIASSSDAPLTQRERMLLQRVDELEQRVSLLEKKEKTDGNTLQNAVAANPLGQMPGIAVATPPATAPSPASIETKDVPDFSHTTLNLVFDGYYGYNFNSPIGRANLLRAYDVSSNSFSINQADVIIENAADPENGKRYGARLDLQFGQATQTLQGNGANEPRPDIYRAIFQAYGTYVLPVGSGLTVDFGKFASSLGIEGNYTKDQQNYSRSFWFNFLPFYHAGVRAKYDFNKAFSVNYWTVNGSQQTEAFNGFKDQYFGLVIKPRDSITWNVNYYLGQEHPDVTYFPNGLPANAASNLPSLQGVPFQPISNPAMGKLHIFDSYAAWQVTPKFSTAIEADYVVQRDQTNSLPSHADGGALYARYQFAPKLAFAARTEYLSDRGGLFSGTTQALKETTATLEYKLYEGFLIREEWRRDSSNVPYFLTDTLGILRKDQTTATMGLVWWFGPKKGAY